MGAQLPQFYVGAIQQSRGPWRSDARGRVATATLSPSPRPAAQECYASGRLTAAANLQAGAVWAPEREPVTGGWELEAEFQLVEAAQACR